MDGLEVDFKRRYVDEAQDNLLIDALSMDATLWGLCAD